MNRPIGSTDEVVITALMSYESRTDLMRCRYIWPIFWGRLTKQLLFAVRSVLQFQITVVIAMSNDPSP